MYSVSTSVIPESSGYVDVAIPAMAHSRIFVLPRSDNKNRRSATEPSKSVNQNYMSRKYTINGSKASNIKMYQTESTSFKSRINQIVRGRPKRRANTIALIVAKDSGSDSEDLNNPAVQKKLKQERQMEMGLKLIQFCRKTRYCPPENQENKQKTKHHRVLSQTVENYNYMQSSQIVDSQSLAQDFNKSNCYVYSRSKQKVMVVDTLESRNTYQKSSKQNHKMQGFGNTFYKRYLKRYRERYNMLKEKSELLKFVAI